jgi:hypothetical protein
LKNPVDKRPRRRLQLPPLEAGFSGLGIHIGAIHRARQNSNSNKRNSMIRIASTQVAQWWRFR